MASCDRRSQEAAADSLPSPRRSEGHHGADEDAAECRVPGGDRALDGEGRMITALLQFILLTLAVYLLLLGYTRFTCCHRKVVDHGKPGGQRQLGGMKDRPGDQ